MDVDVDPVAQELEPSRISPSPPRIALAYEPASFSGATATVA